MKKLLMITAFAAGSLLYSSAEAQVRINVNIGSQPAWAPQGYDNTQYYYIPDMDVYYDVPAHQFLYLSNRRWVRTNTLPAAYRRYDLYRVHKVALTGRDAYRNYNRDRQLYARFKGRYDQVPIRDSHDNRYAANRNNWKNDHFAPGERGNHNLHDRGRHNGR